MLSFSIHILLRALNSKNNERIKIAELKTDAVTAFIVIKNKILTETTVARTIINIIACKSLLLPAYSCSEFDLPCNRNARKVTNKTKITEKSINRETFDNSKVSQVNIIVLCGIRKSITLIKIPTIIPSTPNATSANRRISDGLNFWFLKILKKSRILSPLV